MSTTARKNTFKKHLVKAVKKEVRQSIRYLKRERGRASDRVVQEPAKLLNTFLRSLGL